MAKDGSHGNRMAAALTHRRRQCSRIGGVKAHVKIGRMLLSDARVSKGEVRDRRETAGKNMEFKVEAYRDGAGQGGNELGAVALESRGAIGVASDGCKILEACREVWLRWSASRKRYPRRVKKKERVTMIKNNKGECNHGERGVQPWGEGCVTMGN